LTMKGLFNSIVLVLFVKTFYTESRNFVKKNPIKISKKNYKKIKLLQINLANESCNRGQI
jgi:hypothetical protein